MVLRQKIRHVNAIKYPVTTMNSKLSDIIDAFQHDVRPSTVEFDHGHQKRIIEALKTTVGEEM